MWNKTDTKIGSIVIKISNANHKLWSLISIYINCPEFPSVKCMEHKIKFKTLSSQGRASELKSWTTSKFPAYGARRTITFPVSIWPEPVGARRLPFADAPRPRPPAWPTRPPPTPTAVLPRPRRRCSSSLCSSFCPSASSVRSRLSCGPSSWLFWPVSVISLSSWAECWTARSRLGSCSDRQTSRWPSCRSC